MTSHQLHYCQFLLRCVKDLYIEKAAMSTILDIPALHEGTAVREGTAVNDWRSTSADMIGDRAYRSAVEANCAPYFEGLKGALNSEQALASLLNPAN